jgi:DNA-binding MarR family transcriptional regulator
MSDQRPKPTVISKTEYEALAEFRRQLRLFLSFSEAAATQVGLSPHQYQAMLAIKGFPGREQATIGEIAETLQIRHHSAVGLINRLEQQHYVERESSAEDRRRVYVRLTALGSELLEQLANVHKQELKHMGIVVQRLLTMITHENPPPT